MLVTLSKYDKLKQLQLTSTKSTTQGNTEEENAKKVWIPAHRDNHSYKEVVKKVLVIEGVEDKMVTQAKVVGVHVGKFEPFNVILSKKNQET